MLAQSISKAVTSNFPLGGEHGYPEYQGQGFPLTGTTSEARLGGKRCEKKMKDLAVSHGR